MNPGSDLSITQSKNSFQSS